MTEKGKRLTYKWISYSALILISLLLQTALFSKISVLSASPFLIPYIIATVTLLEGNESAAAIGLVGGFLCDAMLGAHEVFYTVVFTILAVLLCAFNKLTFWKNFPMSLLNWALLILFTNLSKFCFILFTTGKNAIASSFALLPGELLATLVFTPFLYMIISKIIKSFSDIDE